MEKDPAGKPVLGPAVSIHKLAGPSGEPVYVRLIFDVNSSEDVVALNRMKPRLDMVDVADYEGFVRAKAMRA